MFNVSNFVDAQVISQNLMCFWFPNFIFIFPSLISIARFNLIGFPITSQGKVQMLEMLQTFHGRLGHTYH